MSLLLLNALGGLPSVKVQPGDSLSVIAKRLTGSSNRWREMLPLNPGLVDRANSIKVGEVFFIPQSWVK